VARPPLDLSLYLVTDARCCGARGVLEVVRAAVRGGVSVVQLRDPLAKTGALVAQARALRELLAPLGIPLIVNDRVDVALAAGADGVHVGQSDMPAEDARALLGPERLLGLSVSSPLQLSAAALGAVDYLGVGPVFDTPTKPDADPALGYAGLRALCSEARLPAVAIGGIHAGNAARVLETGVNGLAVVSAICAAEDPEHAARELAAIVRGTDRRIRGTPG
jgi:thiamine-phosphate pyrophosphorylase